MKIEIYSWGNDKPQHTIEVEGTSIFIDAAHIYVGDPQNRNQTGRKPIIRNTGLKLEVRDIEGQFDFIEISP